MIFFTRRPPRTPRACSLNLRSTRADVPALSFVHNPDIVRIIIAPSGRNVHRERVQPIPAEPQLHPFHAYPFLGFHVQLDNNELVPLLIDNGDDDMIASTLNAAATALSATLMGAAHAASATLMVPALSISATLMVAMITVSATLMVAGIVISGTIIAAASSASALLMTAANAASAFLVAAGNAGSTFLMAAGNAVFSTSTAAGNAASAFLVAAGNAGNAVFSTSMAAGNAGNVLFGLLSFTQTTPLWLVAVVIGISFALSISDVAIYQFFWDFALGALSSYCSQLLCQLFRPFSRSSPWFIIWVGFSGFYVLA